MKDLLKGIKGIKGIKKNMCHENFLIANNAATSADAKKSRNTKTTMWRQLEITKSNKRDIIISIYYNVN